MANTQFFIFLTHYGQMSSMPPPEWEKHVLLVVYKLSVDVGTAKTYYD